MKSNAEILEIARKTLQIEAESVKRLATQLNDNFSYYNGKLEYKNSMIIPENLIYNNKMDSFNPNGVCDFKSAVLTGILNLTLSLFQSE